MAKINNLAIPGGGGGGGGSGPPVPPSGIRPWQRPQQVNLINLYLQKKTLSKTMGRGGGCNRMTDLF